MLLRYWGIHDFNAPDSTVKLSPVSYSWHYPFLNISFVHPPCFNRQRSVTHYEMDDPQAIPVLFCSATCHHLFWSAPKPNSSSRPVSMGGWDLAPSVQSVSQQAHKGPAASTTGNLAWWWVGHAFGLVSIAFHFNQVMQLGIFFSPMMTKLI